MFSMVASYIKKQNFLIMLLIPFALLGMTGSGISYLKLICNSNTRWIILGLLLFYFLLKRSLLRYFDFAFFLAFIPYIIWCFFSSFWSIVPALSFLKSSLLFFLPIVLIRTGIEWVRINKWENALNYIWALAVCSVTAGLLGKYFSDSALSTVGIVGGAMLYQGLTTGANMFGMLMVMSFPLFLWKTYQYFIIRKKMALMHCFLSIVSIYYIVLSFSRASILAMLCVIFFFLLSISTNKKIIGLFCLIFLSTSTLIVNPDIVTHITDTTEQYIFKGNSDSVFSSRKRNWEQSYEGAQQGGLLGLGYGMSYDAGEYNFERGLSAIGYGREKGNSQLGIVEETGIVGLVFYILLVFFIFAKLTILYLRTRLRSQKVLIGIVLGTLMGFLVQSCFEAWWGAPGSPESIYFWMLLGVARGLEILIYGKQRYAASQFKTQISYAMAVSN